MTRTILFLVLCSCDATQAALMTQPLGDGRIVRGTITTAEGVALENGWHDTELGIACQWGDDGTGILRCLPIAAAPLSGYFGDADCSVPIAEALGCSAYVYVYSDDPTVCSSPRRYYYAEDTRVTDIVYAREGESGCAVIHLDTPRRWMRPGDAVPLESFQSGRADVL